MGSRKPALMSQVLVIATAHKECIVQTYFYEVTWETLYLGLLSHASNRVSVTFFLLTKFTLHVKLPCRRNKVRK